MSRRIDMKAEYMKVLKSGLFFEMHPLLTGNWEQDREEFTAFHIPNWSNYREIEADYTKLGKICVQGFWHRRLGSIVTIKNGRRLTRKYVILTATVN